MTKTKIPDNRPKMVNPHSKRCDNNCKNLKCEYNPTPPYGVELLNRFSVWNIMALKGCCSYE